MSSVPTLVVGIKSKNNNYSGFNEVIRLDDDLLVVKNMFRSTTKLETFSLCYIKHESGVIIPRHLNTLGEDRSDYLFVVVDNRYVEVFRDVHYKIGKNIELEPFCVLVPSESLTCANKTVELHYSDKLLYFTAMEKFENSIFILNLPDGYSEVKSRYIVEGCPSSIRVLTNSAVNSTSTKECLGNRSVTFYNMIEYFGELQYMETVFFLFNYETIPLVRNVSLDTYYPKNTIFAPSVETTNPNRIIPRFSQINPVDPFSMICYLKTPNFCSDIRFFKWEVNCYFLKFLKEVIIYKQNTYAQIFTNDLDKYVADDYVTTEPLYSLNSAVSVIFNKQFFEDLDVNQKNLFDGLIFFNGTYKTTVHSMVKYASKKTVRDFSVILRRVSHINNSTMKSRISGCGILESKLTERSHIHIISGVELMKQLTMVSHIVQNSDLIYTSNYVKYLDLCDLIETFIERTLSVESGNDVIKPKQSARKKNLITQILKFKTHFRYYRVLVIHILDFKIHYYGLNNVAPLLTINLLDYKQFRTQVLLGLEKYGKKGRIDRNSSMKILCLNMVLLLVISSTGLHLINTMHLEPIDSYSRQIKYDIQSAVYYLGYVKNYILRMEKLEMADDQLNFDVSFKLFIVSEHSNISVFQCCFSSSNDSRSITLIDRTSLKNIGSTYSHACSL